MFPEVSKLPRHSSRMRPCYQLWSFTVECEGLFWIMHTWVVSKGTWLLLLLEILILACLSLDTTVNKRQSINDHFSHHLSSEVGCFFYIFLCFTTYPYKAENLSKSRKQRNMVSSRIPRGESSLSPFHPRSVF